MSKKLMIKIGIMALGFLAWSLIILAMIMKAGEYPARTVLRLGGLSAAAVLAVVCACLLLNRRAALRKESAVQREITADVHFRPNEEWGKPKS